MPEAKINPKGIGKKIMNENYLMNGANVEMGNEVINDQNLSNEMEKYKVYTATELANKGKMIARLEANRDLNPKAVNDKKKSLLAKGQLVPAVMVEAVDAVNAGLKVVEFTTGVEIKSEELAKYVVLLDGNHRYEAHRKLVVSKKNEYKKDYYLMYTLQPEVAIAEALAEINIATTPWKGADYVKGALLMIDEDVPVLDAIGNLTSKGYSLDAAAKWITMGGSVSKSMLVKATAGNIDKTLKSEDVAKLGLRFWEAVHKLGFEDSFLGKRTFVGCLLNKWDDNTQSKQEFVEIIERFCASVDKGFVDKVQNAKGSRGESKEGVIEAELNPYWEAFVKGEDEERRRAKPAA